MLLGNLGEVQVRFGPACDPQLFPARSVAAKDPFNLTHDLLTTDDEAELKRGSLVRSSPLLR